MLETLIDQLTAGQPLSREQIQVAVEELVDAAMPTTIKADFLSRLAQKGETPEEIAAFAHALRDKSVPPPLDVETRSREILDVVGTGGDRLSTFNISSTAALICAAGGVTVAKHGNRAVTSLIGSADVMEALGIPFDVEPEDAARMLREQGFAFFFAPKYQPAFRHIAPARKLCAERGQRTIFNFIGPLLNPARPTAMLVGVPRPDLCEPLARVLQSLGVRRAMVVCGAAPSEAGEVRHLDEISTLGPTTIAEFYQARALTSSTLQPDMFPLQPATLADLRGGDRETNATTIRRVLGGEERGPKRDIALLNAAAALFVAGQTRTITDGWTLAAELIDSGRAQRKLLALAGS